MTGTPLPSIENLSPKQQAELAALSLALADRSNPTRRKQFAALVKEAAPQFAASFDDVEVENVRDLVDTKFAEREQKEAQAALTRRLEKERKDLVSSGRFDEDGIKKLEKFMEQRGYGSYTDAAILYAHEHPPEQQQRDGAPTPRGWEMPGNDWKKDPRGMARKLANDAVGELMRKRA